MDEKSLVKVWQWLSVALLSWTVSMHSASQGRKIGLSALMPDGVLYEPAAVYGLVVGAPMAILAGILVARS
jgi:hypothetical protein